MKGMGALSYFFDLYMVFLSSTEKMPVGVGLASLPLEMVETATSVSPR
jgi:hypothetical protein